MYLLDTTIVSEVLKKRPDERIMARLGALPAHELATSTVTVMELRYGSALRADEGALWRRIQAEVLSRVQIILFDSRAAELVGDLQAILRRMGRPVGMADIMIAAIARSIDATVVTRNSKHFRHIPRLNVETWE